MTTPLLRRLAGGALLTTPLLLFGAMLTSPPQDDDSTAGYLASLAKDWDLSILSANLFHYYWVAIALAVPAVLTLLRGPRGRTLTAIGVAATAFGAVQMSGVLFADWMNAAMPAAIPLDQAVTIADRVMGDPSMIVWLRTGVILGIAMPAVLMAGLARNGVIGWWAVPVALLPMVAGPIVGSFAGGVLGSLVGALCCAPLVLIGVRLLSRTTAGVTEAERAADAPALAV
ncbi:hypothetical protein [Paractinoplanes rishiriensis]|uniref:DUF4386 family protein n=1 Tax=Paractinoplanes rishiriensis TaxID=1050105 RepID=A0A919JTX1_9ACTN|nr:hypothetical protein [Actinoplanes rishiriensis]GIE93282.1 hypothetical protein Ari01nite_07470 [Actinoplanes rishiriensis]